jgi:hypothetical protein
MKGMEEGRNVGGKEWRMKGMEDERNGGGKECRRERM